MASSLAAAQAERAAVESQLEEEYNRKATQQSALKNWADVERVQKERQVSGSGTSSQQSPKRILIRVSDLLELMSSIQTLQAELVLIASFMATTLSPCDRLLIQLELSSKSGH